MQKTGRSLAAGAAVLTALGAGATVAAAQGDGPQDFKASAKVTDSKVKGDTLIVKEKLKSGGEQIGKAKVKLDYGGGEVSGRWTLDDGRIKAKGKLKDEGKVSVKIVKGTRAYAGAKGKVVIENQSPKRNRETFKFK